MDWVAVFLGGGLGAMSRFGIGGFAASAGFAAPWGTFAANAIGGLLIGVFAALWSQLGLEVSPWKNLVFVGFLGGLTTFSTFSFEVFSFIKEANWSQALLYAGGSVGVCVALASLGWALVFGLRA